MSLNKEALIAAYGLCHPDWSHPLIRGVPKVMTDFNIRSLPSREHVYLKTAKVKITGSNFQNSLIVN